METLIGIFVIVFALGAWVGFTLKATPATDEGETERLRLQLTACGVAAMGNTREEVGKRLDRDSPYWSASYGDVCRAIDREMELRDTRDSDAMGFIGWVCADIPELHRVEVPRLVESWDRYRARIAIAREPQ